MLSKYLIKNKNWIFIGIVTLIIVLLCFTCCMRQNYIEEFTNQVILSHLIYIQN